MHTSWLLAVSHVMGFAYFPYLYAFDANAKTDKFCVWLFHVEAYICPSLATIVQDSTAAPKYTANKLLGCYNEQEKVLLQTSGSRGSCEIV
jgi:hypothetical protein